MSKTTPKDQHVPQNEAAMVCITRPYFDLLLTQAANYDELQTLLAFIRVLADHPDGTLDLDEESLIRNQQLNAVLSTNAVSQSSTSRIMRALNQAVIRGALIRSSLLQGNRQSILYRLGSVESSVQNQSHPGPQVMDTFDADRSGTTLKHNGQAASVYATYENNIGLLTPLVADQIRLALELYPASWIHEAISEAVAYNRRQWRYIQRILQKWSVDGRISGPANEVNHATNKRGPARAIDTD